MARNSDTKKYNATSSGGKSQPARRNSAKKIALAITVAVLTAIILTAVVFVIRDLALQERNPSVPDPENPGTSASSEEVTEQPGTPDNDPSKHPAAHAIDGNNATYMVSDRNQSAGSYLLLELGEETDVMNVEIVSDDAVNYIRRADVWTSTDKVNWAFFGEFSFTASDPNPKTVSKGMATAAKYLRIILTDKADAQWIVNEVNVLSQDDAPVTLTRAELGFASNGVVTEPSGTTESAPQGGYVAKVMQNAEIYTGDLIVVNAKHQYLFPASTANILPLYDGRPEIKLPNGSTVIAYKVGGSTLPALQATALKAFNTMIAALADETGITEVEVGTNDAWRSRETQDDLYKKYPTTASPTGLSEHNTGLGVNINLMNDAGGIYKLNETANKNCATVYNWLTANAHKYGFTERFKAAKKAQTGITDDYHYRYVGYAHAYYMKQNNLCLEEYVEALHAYTYGGNHLTFTGDDGHEYEIYYVPMDKTAASTQLYVPSNLPYTVSGDNYSGFIITVTK